VSTEENKLLVRRCLEEVVNTGDVGRLAEFIAPDYVEVYRDVRCPMGLGGAGRHVPDGREVNLAMVVDGRIVEHGGAPNLLEPFLEAEAIRVVH